jgi:hypothetical protein
VQPKADAILDLVRLSLQRLVIHWISVILLEHATKKLVIAPILKNPIIHHATTVLAAR